MSNNFHIKSFIKIKELAASSPARLPKKEVFFFSSDKVSKSAAIARMSSTSKNNQILYFSQNIIMVREHPLKNILLRSQGGVTRKDIKNTVLLSRDSRVSLQ